jgi:hypothetical protein
LWAALSNINLSFVFCFLGAKSATDLSRTDIRFKEIEIEEFAGFSCHDRVIVARLHLTFLSCRVTMGFFYTVYKKFKEKKSKGNLKYQTT